jgi:hypothetical protein
MSIAASFSSTGAHCASFIKGKALIKAKTLEKALL